MYVEKIIKQICLTKKFGNFRTKNELLFEMAKIATMKTLRFNIYKQ